MFGESHANDYPKCPMCHGRDWVPKSRVELGIKGGRTVVKQLFDCAACRLRARLRRFSDSPTWAYQL